MCVARGPVSERPAVMDSRPLPLPLPLLLLLLVVVLLLPAAGVGAAGQLLTLGDDVTREQLGCLVSYLESKDRRTVDVYIDDGVTEADPALLLRLLSSRLIFARLQRGTPPVPPQRDAVSRLPSQVVWFAPETDSPELDRLMAHVRADQSLAWLLVALRGREAHFLGEFAPRHHYMVREQDTDRFYSGMQFHSRAGPRAQCVGQKVEKVEGSPRSAHEKSRRLMEGVPLRLLYMDPPYTSTSSPSLVQQLHVQVDTNGTITGGLMGSLILLLQNVFGFTYSLRAVRPGPNTTAFDEAALELSRGTADMFAGRLLYSPRRGSRLDFSIPFMAEISGAIVDTRYTKTLSRFNVTRPMQSSVWWALLATQGVAVLVLALIASCQLRLRRALGDAPSDDADVTFWALIVLGVGCQQGASVRSDAANSYRLAITALYLLSLFIFACYSGNLLAEMTVEQRQMPFESLSEALEQGWKVSEDGMSQAVRETIVDPLFDRKLSSSEMTRAGPMDGKNLLLAPASNTNHMFNCTGDAASSSDDCPVCMWGVSITRHRYSFVTRRRFPYLRAINYILPQLLDHGIVSRQMRRWLPRANSDLICPTHTVELKNTQLGPDNLRYMFAIVIGGLIGSIAVLVLERIVFAVWMFYVRRKREKELALFIGARKTDKMTMS